jgi:hypothetical protein
MKRKLISLFGAIAIAMFMTCSMTWSSSASAQTVACSATTCTYGPICVDAWGGCYFYSWKIGSAINSWSEKSGISNIVNLCSKDPTQCVSMQSDIVLNTTDYPVNAEVVCRVPGADTCTDTFCGNSPSANAIKFSGQPYQETRASTVTSSDCTKDDKSKGGIKCSKTNELSGPANLAADFCPNPNWFAKWIPLAFQGTSTSQGPTSRQDPTIVTTTSVVNCVLLDSQGNTPGSSNYNLQSDPAHNQLSCEVVSQDQF